MKLNSSEARILLENRRGKTKDDRWIEHCICVGETAGKIAKAINEKEYNVDIDKLLLLDIYMILVNIMESLMVML